MSHTQSTSKQIIDMTNWNAYIPVSWFLPNFSKRKKKSVKNKNKYIKNRYNLKIKGQGSNFTGSYKKQVYSLSAFTIYSYEMFSNI